MAEGGGALTLRVDRILAGQADTTLRVFVGPGRPGGAVATSIDYRAAVGTDHVVYVVRGQDGQLETNACIGTHPGAPTLAEEAVFGTAAASQRPAPPTARVEVPIVPPGAGPVAAAFIALLALGGAAALALVRLRRAA